MSWRSKRSSSMARPSAAGRTHEERAPTHCARLPGLARGRRRGRVGPIRLAIAWRAIARRAASDPRFDRAAARWFGRLLTETPAGLRDARIALALVERLPAGQDALHALVGADDRAGTWPVNQRAMTGL
jgi:hypothetical protein